MGRADATSDAAATYRSLTRSAGAGAWWTTQRAPAQDANAIVVTAATAAHYHLRSIADLREVAPRLVFGGPPECQERADCLLGLKRIYGLRFKTFVATDTGGPSRLQALEAGQSARRCCSRLIRASRRGTWSSSPTAAPCRAGREHHPAGPPEHHRAVRPTAARHAQCRLGPPHHHHAALPQRAGTLAGMKPRTVASGWLRAQALIPGRQDGAVTEKAEHATAAPGPGATTGEPAGGAPPGAATGEPATGEPATGVPPGVAISEPATGTPRRGRAASAARRVRPRRCRTRSRSHHGVGALRRHHRGGGAFRSRSRRRGSGWVAGPD